MKYLDKKLTLTLGENEQRRMASNMQSFQGRWANQSHYVRSAIIAFNRKIENERLDIMFQARKKPKVRA